MKKKSFAILFIILLLASACSTGKKEQRATAPIENRVVLSQGYDEVWNVLLELLSEDLEYPIEKANKGIIETKWISVINVTGTMRWKLEASVKKQKDGTEVKVTKKVQTLEDSSSKNKRSKKEKEKEPEPGRNLGGWKTGESDKVDEGQILSRLKTKLGM
jgi:uncharacterized lipoprotein